MPGERPGGPIPTPVLPDVLMCAPSPCRDRDYHLKTYKSVLPGSKLVDWLLAQVSSPPDPWEHLLALPATEQRAGLWASTFLQTIFSLVFTPIKYTSCLTVVTSV